MRVDLPDVPGAIGFADDLRARVQALGSVSDDGPPSAWTPEYAGLRLVAAVRAGRGWHGPRSFGNIWPSIIVEFSDLLDEGARANHQRQRIDAEADALERVDPAELRLMTPHLAEEAQRWPMLYLDGEQLMATSLMAWCMAQAGLVRLEAFLRTARLAWMHARERGGEALDDAERFTLDRWKARIAEMDRAARDRHVALVGRFTAGYAYPTAKTSLHRWRKQALAVIADRLRTDGIKVR